MMKQNQKLLLLCGDSYQDISLLAAVNEAQNSMPRMEMLLSFTWAKEMLLPKKLQIWL